MAEKSSTWKVLSIAFLVMAVHNAALHPWFLDDAFISFRYAENFALGRGLVYNAGEKVEGYTCFLWVVLLALGRRVGWDIVVSSKLLGTLFSVGCILLVAYAYRFVQDLNRKVCLIATVLLGTCGIFTPWATSGMEMTMFTFLVLLSTLVYLSARGQGGSNLRLGLVGLISAALTMTRPEGLMIFAILFADQVVASIRKRRAGVFFLLVPFLALFLPYFLWRYSYYGYLLPNTFYAKVGPTLYQVVRGARYTVRFAGPALLLLVPVLDSTLFSHRWFRRYRRLNLLLVTAGAYTLYIILVGGDNLPAYRFFVPVLPLLALISAAAIALRTKTKKAVVFIVTVIAVYNIVQMRIDSEIYEYIMSDMVGVSGKEVGLWFRANVPPDTVIATNSAGSLAYYSKLKTIDMLGLNDTHIAHLKVPSLGTGQGGHEKHDGDYVLSRQPDYILFGPSPGYASPGFPGDLEIYRNPIFREQYKFEVHRLSRGEVLMVYHRVIRNN